MHKQLATGVVVGLLGFALPVAALTVAGATDAAVSIGVGATSTGAGVTLDGGLNTDDTADSASGTTIMPIVLSREDVAVDDMPSSNAPSAQSIQTNAELSSFVAARMKANDHVQQIQASPETVAVVYRIPCKLFGLIPISVDATAIAAADGTVTVNYPWWSFLASVDDQIKPAVADRVEQIFSTSGGLRTASADTSAAARAVLSAQVQAELIGSIEAAFESAVSASSTAAAIP